MVDFSCIKICFNQEILLIFASISNDCKMATNLRKIYVEHGVKTEIAKTLGVCRGTVIDALNGKYSTKKALRIRKVALEKGGVEVNS